MDADRLRLLARLGDQVADDELAALEQRRGRGRLATCAADECALCADLAWAAINDKVPWRAAFATLYVPGCERGNLPVAWEALDLGGYCREQGGLRRLALGPDRCRPRRPTDCPP